MPITPPTVNVAALVGDTPETLYKTYAYSFEKDEFFASNLMNEIISISSFTELKNKPIWGTFWGTQNYTPQYN